MVAMRASLRLVDGALMMRTVLFLDRLHELSSLIRIGRDLTVVQVEVL